MNAILLKKFNESQRQETNWGLLMQVDVSLFAHVKLPSYRMKKIRFRLWKQKVDYYAVGLSIEQRREVEYGLLQGVDVFAYANANIPVLEMEKLRNTLLALAERNGSGGTHYLEGTEVLDNPLNAASFTATEAANIHRKS